MGRFAVLVAGVAVGLGVALPVDALRLTAARAQPTTPASLPAATRDERYTFVVPSVPSPSRWFMGTDGQVHLVYELRLTNGLPVPVTVTLAEALDASDGRSLMALSGEALTAASPLNDVIALGERQEPIPIDPQGAGPRRDALPLGRDVVAFPD